MAWDSDQNVVNGLPQNQTYTNPRITIYDDGTLKAIVGSGPGVFYGYYWDGSTWVLDNNIVNGLPSVSYSTPTTFNDGGTWKLITGSSGIDCYGFYWDGISAWVSDPSIVVGLPTTGYPLSAVCVFDDGGTWKLFMNSTFADSITGFVWDGVAWTEDSDMINGLDRGIQENDSPYVYDDGGTLKLICGGGQDRHGFYRDGTTWIKDNTINYGLPTSHFISPSVCTIATVQTVIVAFSGGGAADDGFYGATVSATNPSFTCDDDKGSTKKAKMMNRMT